MSRKVQVPLGQLIKILMMVTALFAIVALRGACAEGVRNLFNAFAPPGASGDAGSASDPRKMTLGALLDAGIFNDGDDKDAQPAADSQSRR